MSLQNIYKYIRLHWAFLAIISTIILVNFSPGLHFMGLDNASPFFNFSVTLHRILSATNLFEYGGVIFALPWTALSLLGIPSWAISQLFYWGAFIIGTGNFYSFILNQQVRTAKNINLFLPLLLIGNLVPIWIFSQPTFLFAASYAGIATMLRVLQQQQKFITLAKQSIGILYFAMTSINPVAFFLYTLQVVAISYLLRKEKTSLRYQFNVLLGVFVTIAVIFQIFLLSTGRKTYFILSELLAYLEINIASPLAQEVTDSLRRAEISSNSFINVIRFATGWLQLNDINTKPVFTYADVYTSNLFLIFIGTLPFLIFLFALKKKLLLTKEQKSFFLYFIITLFLSTSYSLLILGNVPLVRDGLRWISSKTWPTIYVGTISLVLFGLSHLEQIFSVRKWKIVVSILIATLLSYSFPWFTGNLVNSYSKVALPQEYQNFSKLTKDDTLFVLPKPQKLFFRYYDWGYYGTDFLSYLTYAKVKDGTSISQHPDYLNFPSDLSYYIVTEEEKRQPCTGTIVEKTATFTLFYCTPEQQ